MAQLFPEGTVRRAVLEVVDRSAGWILFGQYRPLSNICGDKIVAGKPCRFCDWLCKKLNKVEERHCERNAGKP